MNMRFELDMLCTGRGAYVAAAAASSTLSNGCRTVLCQALCRLRYRRRRGGRDRECVVRVEREKKEVETL